LAANIPVAGINIKQQAWYLFGRMERIMWTMLALPQLVS
jgi:hypothetical protein